MNSSVVYARVFIPQMPLKTRNTRSVAGMNLSGTADFGNLVALLSGKPTADPKVVIPLLQRALDSHKFIPLRDYLLPVGSPVIIAWTAAIMAMRGVGQLNVLCWDPERQCYHPYTTNNLYA